MNPVTIDPPTRISEPGEYVLADDVQGEGAGAPSEALVSVESGGVVVDGRGHTLVGDDVSDTTAVAAGAPDATLADVTVRNLRVVDWEFGLSFDGVERATVRDVEAAENSYGLLFGDVQRGRVVDCVVRDNLVGVRLSPASDGVTVAERGVEGNHFRDILRDGADG